jgi:hypothetical protein
MGAQKTKKFACSLCKIGWEKPYTTFVEVVEGTAIYNFPIYPLVHFCYKILRKIVVNSAMLKPFCTGTRQDSAWRVTSRTAGRPAVVLAVHERRGRPVTVGLWAAP